MNTMPEDEVGALLERAGARPEVPAEHLAQMRAAFRDEWRQQVAARQRARSRQRWALAAVLVLAVGAAALWWRPAPPAPTTAPAPRVAWLENSAGLPDLATPGQPFAAGDTVTTPAANAESEPVFAALRLATGPSVRLDHGTQLRLATANRLELLAGAVYVDSGEVPGDAVEVSTVYGVVRHIGTQFEVRLLSARPAVRVRVREGLVALSGAQGEQRATAGVELIQDAQGELSRGSVALQGEPWSWAVAAAPPFPLDGSNLDQFLRWVTRETGWRVRVEDPALAARLPNIELHGDLRGINPAASLAVVLAGTGLEHRVEGGEIRLWDPRLRTPN